MFMLKINTKLDKQVYSTTETKTNKVWIDNKPIYRKVYKFTNPSTSSPGYNLDINNLGDITHISFIGDYNYNNYRYRRESTYFASNDYMNCFIRDNTIQLRFESNFRAGINTLYVTLEYTKTTDKTSQILNSQ